MTVGKLTIETEISNKKFDAQIEQTKAKIKELEAEAETLKKHLDLEGNPEMLREVNAELEKQKNHLYDLQQMRKKNKFGDDFKDGLKSLKKFALGLVGIRGLYSLARRASSAWLSQDTELAQKFQNIWLALGSALAPVLEWLANALQKLLGYLNEFVKAFTGGKVDLIANANAKAIKNQANAMKELKNQTYGFDELNIQQVNESSSSGATNTGLGNIELNKGIADTIGKIGKKLGDITQWVKDNLGEDGVIMLGIATVLGVMALPAFGGKGLLAIYAVALAIYDLLKAIGIIKEWKDVKESAKKVSKELDTTKKSAEGLKDRLLEAFDGKTYEDKRKGISNSLTLLSGEVNKVDEDTKRWEKDTSFSVKGIINSFNGVGDASKKQRDIVVTSTQNQIEALLELAEQGELTDEEFKQLKDIVNNYFDVMKDHNNKTMGLLKSDVDKAEEYITRLGKINATPTVTITVNAKDNTKSIINNIQKNLSSALGINIAKSAANLDIGNLLANLLKFSGSITTSYGATGGVLNKSAVGSIINNPGRGVYVGANTIGGESGKEGLIPLTDPNAMSELGETIAKFISINLTNITKLDSKTINKETKKVGNEMGFATNGGAY